MLQGVQGAGHAPNAGGAPDPRAELPQPPAATWHTVPDVGPRTVTSLLADNDVELYRAIFADLAAAVPGGLDFVEAGDWRARQARFDEGTIEAAFMCGWPYTVRRDRGDPVEPLAAPVFNGARYQGRPCYFSDVVVAMDSAFSAFADLLGARWAFNEPGSHSGFNVIRHHLDRLGHRSSYFGSALEAGSHAEAIRMVLDGRADAAAIDSRVLEVERAQAPGRAAGLRVVEVLGPSPTPPLVVRTTVPEDIRRNLQAALTGMHESPAGRAVLSGSDIARFVAVTDADYDPIRRMTERARGVELATPQGTLA